MEFTVDTSGIDRVQYILSVLPKGAERAMLRATSRALVSGRMEAIRAAKETYDAKSSAIRAGYTVYAPKGELRATGERTSLTKFKVTPKKPSNKEVSASVKKAGGRIPHAFVARMDSGHVGVFKRTGTKSTPIEELYSVSIPQMLGEPGVLERTGNRVTEVFEERIWHEIDRLAGE